MVAVAESIPDEELTLEDWIALPEDEPGELIDGYLEDEEMPDYVHELLVMFLGRLFGNWIFSRGGFVAGSEAKFAVGANRGRKPDLSVYFPGRRPPARGVIRTPPDIVVEIVSPRPRDGRRDRIEKMADYAGFGVRYYWIVDPQLRGLEVFELGKGGRYTHVLGASGGVVDDVPGCEGLSIDLDALWGEVDRLEDDSGTSDEG